MARMLSRPSARLDGDCHDHIGSRKRFKAAFIPRSSGNRTLYENVSETFWMFGQTCCPQVISNRRLPLMLTSVLFAGPSISI
jgi:hypothetical protein